MMLAVPLAQVFAFFSDASNLERITPPELHFRITTPRPLEISSGTIIDYRLSLFGLPFAWKTRIAEWTPPHVFVDEQLEGPYRQWIHRHTFRAVAGGTEIADEVRYRLPLSPIGELAWPVVALQVRRIFAYREKVIRAAFE